MDSMNGWGKQGSALDFQDQVARFNQGKGTENHHSKSFPPKGVEWSLHVANHYPHMLS